MKKCIGLFVLSCTFLLSAAQLSEDPIVLTIGQEKVTLSEFETIFMKNHPSTSVTKTELDEYMELFVKYKLKVNEASALGMDTTQAFRQEFDMYRKQLAQPYLKAPEIEQEILKEAYERLKNDYKVRQILVKVSSCAPAADTLAAYKKAELLRKEVLKTKKFADVARKSSEDSVSAANGGSIGWITALQSAYQFESAFCKLKPGEVSPIFRTSQGYHFVTVDEIRPAYGNIKVAHIFIAADPNNKASVESAQTRIQEAYTKIKNGEQFEEVCKLYSEDFNTASAGGVIAPFGIRKMNEGYESKAFSLKNTGDITEPFAGTYGYYIIKLIERVPLPDFETFSKGELLKEVQKSNRWNKSKMTVMNGIKSKYGFSQNDEIISTLTAKALANGGVFSKEYLTGLSFNWVFKIGNESYSWEELMKNIDSRMPADKTLDVCTFQKSYLDPFIENKLVAYKEQNLEKEDPKFRALITEYHEGILLFNIMNAKVWNKSIEDTTGLANFYETTKNNYMWGERAEAYLIDCKDAATEKAARKLATKLQNGKITKAKFIESLNKKDNAAIVLSEGLYSQGENAAVDKASWAPGIGESISKDGKIRFAVIKQIQPPKPKLLKEVKGLIISEYQNYLENNWLAELRVKYPVSINSGALYQLVK